MGAGLLAVKSGFILFIKNYQFPLQINTLERERETLKTQTSGSHITWFSQHRNATSDRGGGERSRLQSQGDQDLCAAAAAHNLIFKTSTEERTVDLTNKDMTKDSHRFSRWFHSVWRTTGPVGL